MLRVLSRDASRSDKAGTAGTWKPILRVIQGHTVTRYARGPTVTRSEALPRGENGNLPSRSLSPDERPSAEPDWATVVHGCVYAAVFTRAEPVVGPLSVWLSRRAAAAPIPRRPALPEFSGAPPSTYPSPMFQPHVPCPRFHCGESSDLGCVRADRQRSQLYPPAVSGGAVWRATRASDLEPP